MNFLFCHQVIVKCPALSLRICQGWMFFKRELAFFLLTGLADTITRGLRAFLYSVCERIRTIRSFYLVGINLSHLARLAAPFIALPAITQPCVLMLSWYKGLSHVASHFYFWSLWGWNGSHFSLRSRTGIWTRVQWTPSPVLSKRWPSCLLWKTTHLCKNTAISKVVSGMFFLTFILFKWNLSLSAFVPLIRILLSALVKWLHKIVAKVLFLF